MALPAGPMAALTTALDGICVIWTPEGGERLLPMTAFIHGPQQTALCSGELLRAVDLPAAALTRRSAFRRISLSPLGRSAALLIGTLSRDSRFAVTVTAATRRPIRLDFESVPSAAGLRDALAEAIPGTLYYDDLHGSPDWRCHMTFRFAEQIRQELASA
jgi:CO/xanthine dehydrogenase FAD-binding subunit